MKRTLPHITVVLTRIINDQHETTLEQQYFRDRLQEVPRLESEQDYQSISRIIDTFFSWVKLEIFKNKLSLSESYAEETYHKEFIEFFEITKHCGGGTD